MSNDTQYKNFSECSYGSSVHKLSPKECLNCEHFEKKKDRVDVWLEFFEAYKKKDNGG
jgi:hypothetical protein